MRVCTLTLLYFLMCMHTQARADEFIGRRPGLWQVTVTPIAPKAPPVVFKMCLDADIAKNMRKGIACERDDMDRDGNRIAIDSVCSVNGSRLTTKAIVTLAGDTAYHVDIKEHADPPFEGHTDGIITQDGKWLGACPAGAKPGVVIDANDSGK
jgi:hypothetical protein